jgi:hypothetical protein
MGYMLDHIGEPAMYEQMAEECAELAKAALKMARIERGENPTPKTKEQAMADLIEEYTDVCICADELGLKADPDIAAKKLARCVQRQNQFKNGRHITV